jgi:hypothetical protein
MYLGSFWAFRHPQHLPNRSRTRRQENGKFCGKQAPNSSHRQQRRNIYKSICYRQAAASLASFGGKEFQVAEKNHAAKIRRIPNTLHAKYFPTFGRSDDTK